MHAIICSYTQCTCRIPAIVFILSFFFTCRCSSKRGYRVPAVAMLNLTYGEMRKHGHHHQQAAATPPRSAWQQQQQQQQQQQMPAYSHHGNRQGQGWGQGSYVALTRQGQGQGSYSALLRQEGQRQGPGRRDVMAPRQVSVLLVMSVDGGGWFCWWVAVSGSVSGWVWVVLLVC